MLEACSTDQAGCLSYTTTPQLLSAAPHFGLRSLNVLD
jgi:hypothetical protein